MSPDAQILAEIESCVYLFLREITELDYNGLRVVIEEGIASSDVASIDVGDTRLMGHPVRPKEESRRFELIWDSYIAYSVRNESYVTSDESEQVAEGRRIPAYSKSHFLDYVSHATFAQEEFPGPLHHTGVICQNHIIDVVSTATPRIRRIWPE